MFPDVSDFVVLFSLEFNVGCVSVIVDECPHWLSSRYFVIRRGVVKGFSFPSVSDCSHLNIIGLGCRCVVYYRSRAAGRTCSIFLTLSVNYQRGWSPGSHLLPEILLHDSYFVCVHEVRVRPRPSYSQCFEYDITETTLRSAIGQSIRLVVTFASSRYYRDVK